MTYRVAFAISGAVSLGSYEAGTMYEIIRAFAEHNNSMPEGEYFYDVPVGEWDVAFTTLPGMLY